MAKFLYDEHLCIECYACEVACRMWHDIPAGEDGYRVIKEEEEGIFPHVKRTFTTSVRKGCDLCRSTGGFPRCAATCPTQALRFE